MNCLNIVAATKNWLSSFIIGYNICPFAKRVFEQEQIRYQVLAEDDIVDCLESLLSECHYLDANPATETTLLILANAGRNFDDYLDLLAMAEQLLIEQGYEGVYQLASFHPEYCFAGEPADDPAHYTNRSPFPMLHIIREEGLEKALETYPNPELIPKHNIDLTRSMGLQKLQAILAASQAIMTQTDQK